MDLKGKIPKNLSSGTVLKRYVFKFISPLYILRIYIQAPVGKGFIDLKQGHNSAGAGHRPLIEIKRLSQPGQRPQEPLCHENQHTVQSYFHLTIQCFETGKKHNSYENGTDHIQIHGTTRTSKT